MCANLADMKFTKVRAGFYATEDGRYAVAHDGYEIHGSTEDQEEDGLRGNEWGAIYDPAGRLREDNNAGQNLDWLDTKREAVAVCEDHAR